MTKTKSSDYRKLSDEELVRHYIELHEYNAYNTLFERFGHIVYGICLRRIGNPNIARKKTEEIFIQMLHDLRKQSIEHFRPWLYNYVVEHTSGIKNSNDILSDLFTASPLQNTGDSFSEMEAMMNLSTDERLCIKLFYEEKKSIVEISRETGFSLSNIKALLHSGKEHIAQYVGSNDQLAHIFDSSVCLNRWQVRSYTNGDMISEERHAVEHHLNNCRLCSMMIEGMELNPDEAAVQLAELNTGFLHDHFSITYPQVHVSSFGANSAARKNKTKTPLWVNLLLGVVVSLAVVIVFYAEKGKFLSP